MDLTFVRVIGLGNVLMGDDAAGPWVIEELLAGWVFPENVAILDVGTPGLDLTPYLADAQTVIVVDTVAAPDASPGEILFYSRETLMATPWKPRLSPHDPGLSEALLALTLAGSEPDDVLLVGIVPGAIATGIGLTPAVRDAIPKAALEVLRFLELRGVSPIPRPNAFASPWWEAGAVSDQRQNS